MTRLLWSAAAVAVMAGGVWALLDRGAPEQGQSVDLVIPELTEPEQEGEALFSSNCASCHGENASGTEQGPPLVHRIYEPGHHADISFMMAVRNGVRAHHWQFGDMPPVTGVSDDDVARIVGYVRALQRANGIE